MLAYQPVRALSTLTMNLNQGLSAAARILPIIDQRNQIKDKINAKSIEVIKSNIKFKNVNFSYDIKEAQTLKSLNLEFEGGKNDIFSWS